MTVVKGHLYFEKTFMLCNLQDNKLPKCVPMFPVRRSLSAKKMLFLTLRIISNSSQTQFSIIATAVTDTQGTDDITYSRSQLVHFTHICYGFYFYTAICINLIFTF